MSLEPHSELRSCLELHSTRGGSGSATAGVGSIGGVTDEEPCLSGEAAINAGSRIRPFITCWKRRKIPVDYLMQVLRTARKVIDTTNTIPSCLGIGIGIGIGKSSFRRVQVLLALRARFWPTVFILAEHTEVNPVWQSSPWLWWRYDRAHLGV